MPKASNKRQAASKQPASSSAKPTQRAANQLWLGPWLGASMAPGACNLPNWQVVPGPQPLQLPAPTGLQGSPTVPRPPISEVRWSGVFGGGWWWSWFPRPATLNAAPNNLQSPITHHHIHGSVPPAWAWRRPTAALKDRGQGPRQGTIWHWGSVPDLAASSCSVRGYHPLDSPRLASYSTSSPFLEPRASSVKPRASRGAGQGKARHAASASAWETLPCSRQSHIPMATQKNAWLMLAAESQAQERPKAGTQQDASSQNPALLEPLQAPREAGRKSNTGNSITEPRTVS
ncbi:hypothetical protein G7046_g8544 [Stylonectria norvegica]|nr:hypothetical protein G7046_g8544 [Stylonectria norvegica]